MKRIALLAGVAAIVLILAGCSTDYSNTTVTGKVTDIGETTVTLKLGELTETTTESSGMDSGMGGSSESSGGTSGMPSDMGGSSESSGGTSGMPGGNDTSGGMSGAPGDMGGTSEGSGDANGNNSSTDNNATGSNESNNENASGGSNNAAGNTGGTSEGSNNTNGNSANSASASTTLSTVSMPNGDTNNNQNESDNSSNNNTGSNADNNSTGSSNDSNNENAGDSSEDSGSTGGGGESGGMGGMPGGDSSGGMGGMPGGDSSGGMPGGDSSGGMPGGSMGGSTTVTTVTFTEGDEIAVINLNKADNIVSESLTGEEEKITFEDIAVDDVLVIVFGDNNAIESVTVKATGETTTSGSSDNAGDSAMGGMSGGMPGGDSSGGMGGGDTVSQGTAANTIDEDGTYKDETYTSTGDNENALRVTDATVTLDSITVDKSGGASSDADSGDFYGSNAALLVTDGAEATITNATVTSNAQHGNGVFSYGTGTVVNISDSTINTSSDGSGGLQTTGGGTMNASNLTVETQGGSSAAIRSDRGGGTVNVDRGTYTSNGHNSPAIYSTADITVTDAKLTATGSEAFVIEGKNSITLNNCESEGNMSSTQGASSDENVHNVMIYQSMSGDAEVGRSAFEMNDGTLTGNNGDMFYITNTQCTVKLSNVDIVNKDTDAYLFRVSGNSGSRGWGSAGSNGGDAQVTLDNQTLEGDIIVDSISKLDMTFENGSTLTGTINIVDNAQGGSSVSDNAVITIESGCTWTLTDDCTITSLENNGTINYNGHTITLADGTVLK